MSKPPDKDLGPSQQLTLFDSVCIIVGIIIGVGIFETTPKIAASVSGPAALISLWLVGGLLALVGALCFAELTTTYPKQGGDYVFLTKAYGRRTGFLFVWAQFWIIRPGNIGAMAFVYTRYANQLIGLEPSRLTDTLLASSAVIVLTAINILGVQSGKLTQNLLTTFKVAGLLTVFAFAFSWIIPVGEPDPDSRLPNFGLEYALIMILFTYGGWNDISFVAAEVREPRKNLLRTLMLGTLVVTVVYLLVNLAFIFAMGYDGMASTRAIAADLMHARLGVWGSRFISLLICCSALGAINGMTLTGARIYYALGTEHPLFGWLGKWNQRFGAPIRALVGQGMVSLALIIALASSDGFDRMVIFATPLFWVFLLLVAIALFVLRHKDQESERPYHVILYPLTPILFALTAVFIIYSSTKFALSNINPEWVAALALMTAGVLLSFCIPFSGKQGQ